MAALNQDSGAENARPTRLWRAMHSRYLLGGGYTLAAALTIVAILLAASPPATGPLGPRSNLILTILGANLALILCLLGIMAFRVLALRSAQSQDAGARLHLRFVTLFAAAAVAPALVVFVFYGVLVSRGVEEWFSRRVRTVVESSATVARSYVREQASYLEAHVPAMAMRLAGGAVALRTNPVSFSHYVAEQAGDHDFPAAYLLDRQGRVLARFETSQAPPFLAPSNASFDSADAGDIAVSDDLVRTLYRLTDYPDAYLYVVRPVESGIVSHLREADASLASYREAAASRARIQAIFALTYVETALLVLIGAVWLGMGAANAISGPVGRLVQAAGRVAGGDLTARVDADKDLEEIAVLSRAFNSMTDDLQAQQAALKQAGEEAQQRRRFIETVLSEVSAGVIALDGQGQISAANRQAARLLALPGDQGRGLGLLAVAPEFSAVLGSAARGGEAEEEIDVVRGRESRRLRVRVSPSEGGPVLTFDDITRLVAAQRNAAWKDVARRIAHEIKNPLTPIQLSAERLRKRFRSSAPVDDLETFDRCTDTIIRQVGDIGRMVDEFSAFARMPAPKFAEQDAAELLRAAVFAQRVASPDIQVDLAEPLPEPAVLADGRMLAQALTNVLKNAAEAVGARRGEQAKIPGQIQVRLLCDDQGVAFEVEDNGVGLPAKDRDRLTEPYVTTREKGTGLGLAIVKRILEDHGGELTLTDSPGGTGAMAILRLPPAARVQAPPAAVTTTV